MSKLQRSIVIAIRCFDYDVLTIIESEIRVNSY